MHSEHALIRVPDDDLIRRLGELVSSSRRVEADLVAHVGEVEARRLYAREAMPSMFSYCTTRLHLSEAEAYLRINVARAARRHAVLLEMLRDGRLHLRGIALVAPLLTPGNRDEILARATHRSKREIEELVAELQPQPDVPTRMRRLPGRSASQLLGSRDSSHARPKDEGWNDQLRNEDSRATSARLVTGHEASAGEPERPSTQAAPSRLTTAAPPGKDVLEDPTPGPLSQGLGLCPGRAARFDSKQRSVVEPLAPSRYRVEFTASTELQEKLLRLQALMRSEVPDGDLAAIIEKAVSEKLERLEARRLARTRAPRKTLAKTEAAPISRGVPAAVRRAVIERDRRQCRYVDGQGRRCPERHRLEFHHRHPFAMGGDHSLGNVMLLCRAHNQLLAEHDYGRVAMDRHRKAAQEATASPP